MQTVKEFKKKVVDHYEKIKKNRCKRCNRKLNNLESLLRGYGHVCFLKVHAVDQIKFDKIKNKTKDK